MEFSIHQTEEYALIKWDNQDSISPLQLQDIYPPDSIKENFAHKGVVLSGKGPIWLYGFLIHYYHSTKFIATYDPRLQGAVVVETHGSPFKVGDVIPIEPSFLISN